MEKGHRLRLSGGRRWGRKSWEQYEVVAWSSPRGLRVKGGEKDGVLSASGNKTDVAGRQGGLVAVE